MAEIPLDALVPHASGPVASVYLVPGARTAVLKVYPQPLDRRTHNAVEADQAKLAGLRSASSIVRVEALDELPDGRTGLRMEFCPQSLPDLVAPGPLPIGDVVVLGQILSSVLAQAHDIGLVHGGVTPANVLERPSGQPALADFGMALRLRFPRDLTADAAYTAPEVLRDGELSEQADVYGLGAVLYLALTGQPPFPARPGESADDVVLRVLREPPAEVSRRDVPPALSGLLMRMLAKEPDARPDAVTVLREFEELVAGRRVPVATIAARPATQKEPRKSRKGLLIGAAAAIALVAVVPVVIQPGQDEDAAAPPPTPAAGTTTSPAATTSATIPIVLKPPVEKGTSVVLAWSFPKTLDRYVVFVAEQGTKEPRVAYNGPNTTATVQVSPGLKYCFQVQGTDGVGTYKSEPRSIRGATCVGGQ